MNREILDALLNQIEPDIKLDDLYCFSNCVLAKSRRMGMAMLLTGQPGLKGDHHHGSYLGKYIGKSIRAFIEELINTDNPLKVCAAIASINSALPLPDELTYANAVDPFKKMSIDSQTTFIGHFPMAEKWRDQGRMVDIVELYPGPGDIHWDDSHQILERTEIVFITGLTLINNTFREVISRTPNAKFRILMGPTVPLSNAFFDFGIHLIGSTLIVDDKIALRFYQHGGGGLFEAPESAIKTVNLACFDPNTA